MTERRVTVRLNVTGGDQLKAVLQGIGDAGATSISHTSVEVDKLNRSFGGLAAGNGGMRQASLQLSQVAQQTMATGNFVQALAIQLPDLMLGFGTFGIAAGVAAGALLPLIANMVGVGEQAKTLDDALTEASDAIDALKSASEGFTAEGVEKAIERYGRLNAEIERLIERQTIVARNDALATLQGTVGAIRGEIDGGLLSSTNANVAALLGVENQQRAVNEQVLQFKNLLSEIEASQGLEAQADAVARMLDFLDGTEAATSQFYSDLVATEAVLREAANRTGELDALMGQATDAAGRFAATDLASPVAAAADQAARLRRLLDQQRADSAVVLDPRDPRFDADRAAFARQQEAFRREQELAERTSVPRVARSGGGGGGGGGGRAAAPDPMAGFDPEFLSQVAASVSNVTTEVGFLGDATKTLASSASDAFVSFVTGAESARDALRSLLSDFGRILAQQAFQGFGAAFRLPGFANGTNFAPGGLAVVGERGPEIVNLPRGSQVYSNEVSRRMGGVTVSPVFNMDLRGSSAGDADAIVGALRAKILPEVERVAAAAVRDRARRGY